MRTILARFGAAVSLPLIALVLSAGIAHAQRSAEAGVTVYRIDAQASDVRLMVYRDGVLSTFGHNHVVSAKEFTGTIELKPQLTGSRVELEFPVDRLVVDDSEARSKEGPDFASVPSKDDASGTRTNMLSASLLDVGRFPAIKVVATSGPADAKNAATLDAAVQLVGREIKLAVPAVLTVEGDRLEASGELALTHSQLGLKPFSALMGALRVADKMTFKYRIRAEKQR